MSSALNHLNLKQPTNKIISNNIHYKIITKDQKLNDR